MQEAMLLYKALLLLRNGQNLAGSAAGNTHGQRWMAVTTADDAHDDFQPKYKDMPSASVDDAIKDDLNKNKVMLYMKGDPASPMCGFSNMACQILNAYGVAYASRNVLADPELREAIKKFSSWPTIPQLYIKGEFVGGSDILMGLHKSGDLKTLLADNGDTKA